MYNKLSDEEIFRKLNEVCTKLNWANSFSHSPELKNQLSIIRDQINFEITERQVKRQTEQMLKSQPSVRNINDNNTKVSVKDTSSTKKKYDGGRMLRSQSPSTPKDE